jgi:hypothetical protein
MTALPFTPGSQFYLPELPYLLPARRHPQTEELRRTCDAWVRENMAFAMDSPADMDLLLEEGAALWTCLVLATASADRLLPLCKYTEYLSVFDNAMVDRNKIGKDVGAARRMFDRVAAILDEKAVGKDFEYGRVLQGIWREMRPGFSDRHWGRFLAEVRRFLSGCVAEISSRKEDEVFDYDTYIKVRRDSVGMGMYFVLGEYGLGLDLGDELAAHAELREIVDVALEHIMLTNDLFSFRAESVKDDHVNALAVLRLDRKMDLQEAVDELYRVIDGKRAAFMAARDRIRASPLGARPGIAAYLDALWHMMAGNLQWSYLTSRYNGVGHRWNQVRSGVVTLHLDRTVFSDRGYWTLSPERR